MDLWLLLEHGPKPPAWNMACDEWLLKNIRQIGSPVLRTYEWDRPSVTIGYFQAFPRELITRYTIIRRLTGGALVVHEKDLTFTVVLPPGHAWKRASVCDRYKFVHERVSQIFNLRGNSASIASSCDPAVASPSGRAAEWSYCFQKTSRYDVLIDGEKVAGGAQRVTRDGLLHQGSIQSKNQPRSTPTELCRAWCEAGSVFSSLHLTSSQERDIEKLANDKYETSEWSEKC